MGASGSAGTLVAIRAFAFLKVKANAARAMIVACVIPTVGTASRFGRNIRTALSAAYKCHRILLSKSILVSIVALTLKFVKVAIKTRGIGTRIVQKGVLCHEIKENM